MMLNLILVSLGPVVSFFLPVYQSLVVQRNGKMFLQDVVNKTTVCFLIPPSTHLLATPCNPVYALSAKQHALFIRGKPKTKLIVVIHYSIACCFRRKVLISKGLVKVLMCLTFNKFIINCVCEIHIYIHLSRKLMNATNILESLICTDFCV